MFLATFGLLMSDVMADALVVEKVALEKGQEIGTTQVNNFLMLWTIKSLMLRGWWYSACFQHRFET